jgi:hypothetical protein
MWVYFFLRNPQLYTAAPTTAALASPVCTVCATAAVPATTPTQAAAVSLAVPLLTQPWGVWVASTSDA